LRVRPTGECRRMSARVFSLVMSAFPGGRVIRCAAWAELRDVRPHPLSAKLGDRDPPPRRFEADGAPI